MLNNKVKDPKIVIKIRIIIKSIFHLRTIIKFNKIAIKFKKVKNWLKKLDKTQKKSRKIKKNWMK